MRKIPVTVRIPAIHGNYEFLIPDNMSVTDAQKLMVRILNSEYGISDNSSDLILIDEKDGKSLRSECSLSQLRITDGAKLVLL